MSSFVLVILFLLSLPPSQPFRSSETANSQVYSPGRFDRRYREYECVGCGGFASVISATNAGIGRVAVKVHAIRAVLVASDLQSLSVDRYDQWNTSMKLISSLPKELMVGCESGNGSFFPLSQTPRCLPSRWLHDNIDRIGRFAENPFLDQRIRRHLAAIRELGPEFPLVNILDYWIEPILLHDIASGVYELLLGFMAMEHISEGDMEDYTPLPTEAVQILLLLLDTVIDLHLRGLHHGDIHPGNVLRRFKHFSEFGPRSVVLSDFGWSSFQNTSFWEELHRFECPPVHDALQLCIMTNEFLKECPPFSESQIGRYCDPLDPNGMKSELQAEFDLMKPVVQNTIPCTAHIASARVLQKASNLLLQFSEESLGFELAYVFDSRLRRSLLRWKRDLTNRMEEMKKDLEAAMEEMKKDHNAAMEEMKKDHNAAMEEMKKDHNAAMEEMKKDHEAAMEEIYREMEEMNRDHEVAMEKIDRDHEAAMEKIDRDHEAAMERMDRDHEAAMERMDRDHEAAMERMDRDHEVAMEKMNRDHEVAMEKIDRDHEAAMEKIDRDHEAAMEEIDRDHDAPIDDEAAVEATKEDLAIGMEKQRGEMEAMWLRLEALEKIANRSHALWKR